MGARDQVRYQGGKDEWESESTPSTGHGRQKQNTESFRSGASCRQRTMRRGVFATEVTAEQRGMILFPGSGRGDGIGQGISGRGGMTSVSKSAEGSRERSLRRCWKGSQV